MKCYGMVRHKAISMVSVVLLMLSSVTPLPAFATNDLPPVLVDDGCRVAGGYKVNGVCIMGGGASWNGTVLTGGGGITVANPGVGVGGTNANAKPGCNNTVSNPIVLSSGNKIEPEFDFTSSGEMPLSFTRTYNHYWKGVGLLGKHWVTNFDYAITFGTALYGPAGNVNHCFARPGNGSCGITTNTVLYAWRPDGRTIKYIKNASDGVFYEDKPEPISKIVVQPNGTFLLYSEDFTYETYASTGHISKIQNAHNISWTFTYTNGTYLNRVTHTSGRYVEFTWTNGQMSAVRDPAGNYYGLAYNANFFDTGMHRLTASSRPGTPASTTTYHYEIGDRTALTGKSFNGVRYSKFTYGVGGYATSSEHNGLEKTTLAYTPGANGLLTVVETNPLGKQTTHVFQDGKPTTVTGHPSTYCPAASYALTEYDSNGYPSMRSDFNNNKTSYTYNAKGQLLTQIEAYGTTQARTTQYEWWGAAFQNRLMRVTVVGLVSTLYDYDAISRIARISVKNLSSSGVANQTRETWFTYTDYGTMSGGVSSPGMLKSVTVDGPLPGSGDSSVKNYDSQGNLTSSFNSLGHTTTYSHHNGLGQPGRITGVNGEIVDVAYDATGRIILKRTYPNGSTASDTTYSYSANGTVASGTTTDGVTTNYQYDTGLRLTKQYRDVVGVLSGGGTQEQQTYAYNLASDLTSSSNWSVEGQPVLKQSGFTDYDELSRPRASRGNNGQNVRYTYDLNGNVKTITDSLNRVTTLSYDALDRVIESKDALNGLTKFEYNSADQLTKVTDPRSKITSYVYDGFGQLWAQYSPDTGTTTRTYDAWGRLAQTTRNDGSWLQYAYDDLGRLTWSGNSTEGRTYGYDWCASGKGRLCNVDYAGGTKHYGYSPYGQVTITRDWTPSSDEWTGYSYDNAFRLAGISYPSGIAVGYGYSQGKLTLMQATINGITQNVVTGMQYQPFGPMSRLTYGNGVIKERSYDLDGRMTVTHDYGWVGHTQHYNSNNEITAIDNWSRPDQNQQFNYDALSRLTGITSPSGNQTLAYDPNGNRTQYNWYPGLPETYQIDPNSNRIVNTHFNYYYDGRGNRSSQSWGGSTTTYAYDGFNRLKSASRDTATSYTNPNYVSANYPAGITTYTVNGLDQRVAKNGPLGSSRFVYAGQNRMLTEYTDGVWTSYVWLGDELVGLVRHGQLFFVHGDHLGRPEVVTDNNNTWRWIAANYAFGRAVLGENNSIGGLNIGLPGQYYDAETGFWYNGMRDYDDRTSGYLQSDPIGLAGGLNTYAYVGGNPVSRIDPLGLQEQTRDFVANNGYLGEQGSLGSAWLRDTASSVWDAMGTSVSFGKCTLVCGVDSTLGTSFESFFKNRAQDVGKKAADMAAKQIIQDVADACLSQNATKIGAKLGAAVTPGLDGAVATYSIYQFGACTLRCAQ